MTDKTQITERIKTFQQLLSGYDLEDLKKQRDLVEEKLANPEIWENHEKAVKINKEFSALKKKILDLENFTDLFENLKLALELEEQQQILSILKKLEEIYEYFKTLTYLNGKFDKRGAILTLTAGAGGVDAQDWTAMLVSMYQAFAKNQNWDANLIEISVGDEGGVKSATLVFKDEFSYGFLKEEIGVHRLIRISPFNSGGTRETSFALVQVLPEGLEKDISINLKEKDLKWDYFMASGKGGQSVNTTYSAVRLTHISTGIAVTCQNERSQQQNKLQAIEYLKNKLAALEIQKKEEYKNEIKGNLSNPEWGSQIRTYTLHPYKMVKDHRIGWETTDTVSIIENGELMPLIMELKIKP